MESMLCPVCHQPMAKWKVTPAYDRKRQIEYRREHYRCEKDDTWGRLETPIGPMRVDDLLSRQPDALSPSAEGLDLVKGLSPDRQN